MDNEMREQARSVVLTLTTVGRTLATAESCTGGLLGAVLTEIPGASAVYLGGVISYAYSVKEALLGVDHGVLEEKGAVCAEVACQMAQGVRMQLQADIGIGITGNAGPGTDPQNPNVGEIYVALADGLQTVCKRLDLGGDRTQNRRTACTAAMELLLRQLAA